MVKNAIFGERKSLTDAGYPPNRLLFWFGFLKPSPTVLTSAISSIAFHLWCLLLKHFPSNCCAFFKRFLFQLWCLLREAFCAAIDIMIGGTAAAACSSYPPLTLKHISQTNIQIYRYIRNNITNNMHKYHAQIICTNIMIGGTAAAACSSYLPQGLLFIYTSHSESYTTNKYTNI